jgi:hypothetical protein
MALPHEQPQHKVDLTGFNIYTHEVTNNLYRKCVDAGVCLPVTALRPDLADYSTSAAYGEFPVAGVDWNMANAYCQWAGGRLPTEAEWEAAARGTDERFFPWGNDPATCTNVGMKSCTKEMIPFQVGSFAAGNSPFGVWDMAGNVWEWVNDWYDANTYATDPASNPVGPWGGEFKVVRGGGINSGVNNLRAAARLGVDPLLSFKDVGFRCVANPLPVPSTISLPDGGHSHRTGDGSSVEDTGGTGSMVYWGTPTSACGSGGTIVVQTTARNSFGGTYSATLDDHPMTCSYSGDILTCRIPLFAAGGSYYAFSAVISGSSDGITYAYSIGILASTLDSCFGSTDSSYMHTASANCSIGISGAQVNVLVSFAAHFNQVFVNDTLLSGCFSSAANEVTCPLPPSLAPGTATVHAIGTTVDGVDTLDFTDPITIPDCSIFRSGDPIFTISAACDIPGRYAVDIRYTPSTVPISRVLIGSTSAICTLAESGHLVCPTGPESVSGGNIPVTLSFDPSIAYGGSSSVRGLMALVPAPTCTGGTTPGHVMVSSVNCSPTGLGLVMNVLSTFSSRSSNLSWRTGSTGTACIADSSVLNLWHCSIPNPVPADLQLCEVNGSATSCSPQSEVAGMVPARCGGGSLEDSWFISVGCSGNAGLPYAAHVSIGGGHNIRVMDVVVDGTGYPCNADPSTPNGVTCDLPPAAASSSPQFRVGFTDGIESTHSFDSFVSLVPTSCSSSGNTPPGIGGLCADNPSAPGWQNPTNAQDVNNDGCVTPMDVLFLINYLNLHAGESLPVSRPAGSAFLDVNGDGRVAPLDVLMIITYLNSHVGSVCTPTCGSGNPTGGEINLKPAPHCLGTSAVIDFYANTGDAITLATLNGSPISPVATSGNGTSMVTTIVPDSMQGTTVNFGLDFTPSGGSRISSLIPVMIPSCRGNTPPTGWSMEPACAPVDPSHFLPGTFAFRVYYPTDLIFRAYGEVAGHGNGCWYMNYAAEHFLEYECPAGWVNSTLWVMARDQNGVGYELSFPVPSPLPPICSTPMPPTPGWILGTPVCVDTGFNVEFNVDHPSALDITAAAGSTTGVTYSCAPASSTQLYCLGPTTFTPGILTLDYTVRAGTTGSVTFDNWVSIVPRYCATPMPPTGGGGGPTDCSIYSNGFDCTNAGCYYYGSACHADPDPCHKYSQTDLNTCEANSGCVWDNKNFTCNTP